VVARLAVNPNAVSKAFREHETMGLIVERFGQGPFILATLGQVALPGLSEPRRSLCGWLATADAAGLDERGIAALASELRDFYERGGGSPPSGAADRRHGADTGNGVCILAGSISPPPRLQQELAVL
jgi:hypothetical protein